MRNGVQQWNRTEAFHFLTIVGGPPERLRAMPYFNR
jgi:hypothetical protein